MRVIYEGDNGDGRYNQDGEQFLIKNLTYKRLHELLPTLNTSAMDDRIKTTLSKYDVVFKTEPQLLRDCKRYLNITVKEVGSLNSKNASLPIEAASVLDTWLKKVPDNILTEKHRGAYDHFGNVAEPSYWYISGKKIQQRTVVLLIYHGDPLILKMISYTEDGFTCQAIGPSSANFLEEFTRRIYSQLAKQLRGKILDQDRKPAKLQLYDRSALIYPPKLERNIDELVDTFNNWCNNKTVPRWGYFLIGEPGTGKTTIGGLLAKMRPKKCTFLYCPAGTIKDLGYIFQLAEILAPTILQIDDIDLIARNREERGEEALVTSFLMEKLEGLKTEHRIFTILTTNDPSAIDPAIINRAGRIGTKLVLENFCDCCDRLIQVYAKKFGLEIAPKAIQEVTANYKKETNLTPDEVRNVCERLYLKFAHRGKTPISAAELAETICDVYAAFHDVSFQKSRLNRPRRKAGIVGDKD